MMMTKEVGQTTKAQYQLGPLSRSRKSWTEGLTRTPLTKLNEEKLAKGRLRGEKEKVQSAKQPEQSHQQSMIDHHNLNHTLHKV